MEGKSPKQTQILGKNRNRSKWCITIIPGNQEQHSQFQASLSNLARSCLKLKLLKKDRDAVQWVEYFHCKCKALELKL